MTSFRKDAWTWCQGSFILCVTQCHDRDKFLIIVKSRSWSTSSLLFNLPWVFAALSGVVLVDLVHQEIAEFHPKHCLPVNLHSSCPSILRLSFYAVRTAKTAAGENGPSSNLETKQKKKQNFQTRVKVFCGKKAHLDHLDKFIKFRVSTYVLVQVIPVVTVHFFAEESSLIWFKHLSLWDPKPIAALEQ